MIIRRHYITLRSSFSQFPEKALIEVTTQELAEVLECTQRNMILLLKRMQEEGWLTWSPKRGRGNRSSLSFLASREDITLQEVQEMVDNKDLHSALTLLHSAEETSPLKDQFQQWLTSQFGFRSELEGERRTDVLRFPLPQMIHSLDPAAIHYTGESHLVNQLFDGLVIHSPKGDGILPHLAHAWEADESRTLWTFYLRKGVRFHHGRELRATDVKYSLERLKRLAPRGLYSWVYQAIVSIEIVDDITVRIKLTERNELFLAFLATNRASIVPEDVCESTGEAFGKHPIGTGPFQLTVSEQDVWILEAFPQYFQGRGFLDRVEIWTMPGKEGRSDLLSASSFQVMHNVRLSEQEAGTMQQIRQSSMTSKYITVNDGKPGPLADPVIRAAVDQALDRAFLLEQLSGDVIEGGQSFWPEKDGVQTDTDIDRYSDTDANPHTVVDPERVSDQAPDPHTTQPLKPNRANRINQSDINLLGASGRYVGRPLVLATIPQYENDALLVERTLARSGIAVEIRLIPAEQFQGSARMSADLLLFAIMLDEQRELRLIDLFTSIAQHASADIRESLESSIMRILTEPDVASRAKLFLEIERMLKWRNSLL
ncbi:MAG: SgrR family transcriptional regulator, partial [Gorillibacterium sp.]|nr:SgrR family transcriptional regulator [Gorillibacterium sp.]